MGIIKYRRKILLRRLSVLVQSVCYESKVLSVIIRAYIRITHYNMQSHSLQLKSPVNLCSLILLQARRATL